MNPTWLIQRMHRPIRKTGGPLDNVHRVFGGGMLQLKKEAWDLLDQECTLDYMGAAEYEFGALPRSLNEFLQDAERLVAFQFEIEAKGIKPGWWRETEARKQRRKEIDDAKAAGKKPRRAKPMKAQSGATIYALCRKEHREEVELRVRALAAGKLMPRDGTSLDQAIDPDPNSKYPVRSVGWYELDNGFFFFVNETMWTGFCSLFGAERPKAEAQPETDAVEVTGVSLVSHCPYCGTDDWSVPSTRENGTVCEHPTRISWVAEVASG